MDGETVGVPNQLRFQCKCGAVTGTIDEAAPDRGERAAIGASR